VTLNKHGNSEVKTDLAWKPKACCDARHGGRDEVVEVAVGRSGQFERAEADVVQSLVVDTERLVGVLDKLVN